MPGLRLVGTALLLSLAGPLAWAQEDRAPVAATIDNAPLIASPAPRTPPKRLRERSPRRRVSRPAQHGPVGEVEGGLNKFGSDVERTFNNLGRDLDHGFHQTFR